MNKYKYENLDKSFEDEKADVEERFEKTFETIYGEKPVKNRSKAIRVSISLPEDEVNYVSYLRGFAIDPASGFYPSISDIYRAGINCLRKLEKNSGELSKEEIIKLIKGL